MTIDEFIAAELERTGKTCYTLEEVERLTERWIEVKTAAAEPFKGWKSNEEIDALLGIGVKA